jgi:hypothetical protein
MWFEDPAPMDTEQWRRLTASQAVLAFRGAHMADSLSDSLSIADAALRASVYHGPVPPLVIDPPRPNRHARRAEAKRERAFYGERR